MTLRPQRTRRYETFAYDSARWDGFVLRAGDIVVCAPIKSGTTWTQMICALLVHQAIAPPEPLNQLSPWLERRRDPIEHVRATLDTQPFRRIIKTHTPLDGIPYQDDLSYVVCGRDPRDAFLSMIDHAENISEESLAAARAWAGMPDGRRSPNAPNDIFPIWITTGEQPWMADGFPFGSVLSLAASYWAFRHQPNLHFVHYRDLTRDLEEEMRRLARFLGIAVDEALWPRLVEGASFAEMKRRADDNAPGAHFQEWRSNADFFRSARMGEWRYRLNRENQDLYEQVASRLEQPLRQWLEHGALGPAGR